MNATRRVLTIAVLSCLALPLTTTFAAKPQTLLETIRAVQSDGRGNTAAAQAWQQLVQLDASQLTTILAGMDGAGPLAANWIRSAVDSIAERTLAAEEPLPTDQLERFTLDVRHDARARRLAFEWLCRADQTAADRLIPSMLNDPGVEFRRDAVARLLDEAKELLAAGDESQAAAVYERALSGARDDDQIKQIVKQLRSLGKQVDLPRHFGFLMDWLVIGPFDNSGRQGFDTVYPPEKELDRDAVYQGKETTVRWIPYSTDDDYGMVDLNEPFGKLKETVGYAWTDFISDRQQQVELRLGCKNAWRLWVNGEPLFGRDEYHRGMRLDQYRMKATFKPGRNRILMKVCQNEQTESWTEQWQFQLRVCDATGTAILPAGQAADPAAAP